MLPLEAIAVLAILYVFFMIGTLRAVRAKQTKRREAGIKPKASAAATRLASKSDQVVGIDG